MPAHPKTSDTGIVAAALTLIEEHGAEQFSMLAVAAKVGVRGPSLYRRFADRTALLSAVETHLFAELATVLAEAALAGGKGGALRSMAFAYRAFAKRHGGAYPLMFSSKAAGEADLAIRLNAAKPVLDHLQALRFDEASALKAARAFTAFCHGFVSMEMGGAFQLGGDIEEAFSAGVELLLLGIASKAKSQ